MIDTEHVLTLFAEANPVPDVDTVRIELEAAPVDLVTLESRSRIMDTKHVEQVEQVTSTRRRRNPALVFAAALLVAFAAVAGGVLLMRGGEEPVTDEPATTVTVTTVTTIPDTTEVPTTTPPEPTLQPVPPLDPGAAWETVASSEGMELAPFEIVYAEGIGWVMVGGPYVMMGDETGASWVNGDPDGVLLDEGIFLNGVVAGGPGVVAYGHTCEGEVGCPAQPVLYGSADGEVWERLDDDTFYGCQAGDACEFAGVTAVAVAGDGTLLATGPDRVVPMEGGHFSEVDTAVWISTNGYSWTRHDIDLASFVPEDFVAEDWMIQAESFDHVVHTGEQWLAFVEIDRYVPATDDWEGHILVLVSPDGADWTVVDAGETFTHVTDVVSGPNGVLAIGSDEVWWSADGMEWIRADLPVGEEYTQAVALDSGFIVAGGATEVPGMMFAYSPDGTTWTVYERDPDLSGAVFLALAGREGTGPEGETATLLVGAGDVFEPGTGEAEGAIGSAIWRWEGIWAE